MPIYEYACRSCGKRFEQRLRFEERLQAQNCPGCGSRESVLCFSAPAVHSTGRGPAAPTCQSNGGACGCGRFS